jgi:hypothetical protein
MLKAVSASAIAFAYACMLVMPAGAQLKTEKVLSYEAAKIIATTAVEDSHRPDAGGGLKHRHDLALPHAGERVGAAALTGISLLGRQPRIGFDPIGGGGGKPRLRGRDGRDVV